MLVMERIHMNCLPGDNDREIAASDEHTSCGVTVV